MLTFMFNFSQFSYKIWLSSIVLLKFHLAMSIHRQIPIYFLRFLRSSKSYARCRDFQLTFPYDAHATSLHNFKFKAPSPSFAQQKLLAMLVLVPSRMTWYLTTDSFTKAISDGNKFFHWSAKKPRTASFICLAISQSHNNCRWLNVAISPFDINDFHSHKSRTVCLFLRTA